MIRSLIFAIVLFFAAQSPAMAFEPNRKVAVAYDGSWLSFLGSIFTIVGSVLEKTPLPHGKPVGYAMEAVQFVLKFVDKVIEDKKIPTTPTPPPGYTDPKPPSYTEAFPPTARLIDLVSPSSEYDAFYASTNRFIDTANDLFNADRNGASAVELSDYVRMLQTDLVSVRNDYRNLGLSIVVSPADIINAQTDFRNNGLPSSEVSYLTMSGFSNSEIQNFADHMINTEIRISRDLDVLEIYDGGVQQLTVVPEPASLTVWAAIGGGVVLWRRKRRERQKQWT